MVTGGAGVGGTLGMEGHFNPAFIPGQRGGQQHTAPDGPRKRYRADQSG